METVQRRRHGDDHHQEGQVRSGPQNAPGHTGVHVWIIWSRNMLTFPLSSPLGSPLPSPPPTASSSPPPAALSGREGRGPTVDFFFSREWQHEERERERDSGRDSQTESEWAISQMMNQGGSLRRSLSSLRDAWRWSAGYLLRKVGVGATVDGWIRRDHWTLRMDICGWIDWNGRIGNRNG